MAQAWMGNKPTTRLVHLRRELDTRSNCQNSIPWPLSTVPWRSNVGKGALGKSKKQVARFEIKGPLIARAREKRRIGGLYLG